MRISDWMQTCALPITRRDGVAGLQDSVQDGAVDGLACIRGLDAVDVPGAGHASVRRQGAQAGFEAFAAERRQGRLALEDDNVRRRSGAPGGVIVAGAGELGSELYRERELHYG